MKVDAASEVLLDELLALRSRIIEQHVNAGQKASGRTIESLKVIVKNNEGTLYGRSPFGTLETGRKPGKVPRRFHAIILKWMEDKRIKAEPIPYKTDRPHKYTPQERGNLYRAYLISRKIAREGTNLFRKGGRSDIYSNAIKDTTERVRMRIVELIKLKVDSIKLNNVEV